MERLSVKTSPLASPGDTGLSVLADFVWTALFSLSAWRGPFRRPFRCAGLIKRTHFIGAGSLLVIFFAALSTTMLVVSAPAGASDLVPGTAQIPDLLDDPFVEGIYGPDLLSDDPYIIDPVELMGDPVFEDDFTLNEPPPVISDPLEPLNRVFFQVNDKLYFWLFKPANTVYSAVLPADIRLVIGNFFNNLAAPIRFLNNLLQGEVEDAGVVLQRFCINSTMGVFGLADAAQEVFDIEPREADFGQTLGKWGIGEGIYLVVPVLGPLNVRDTFGFVGDVYMHPVPYITDDTTVDLTYLLVGQLNRLSLSPPVYEELLRISLDPYVASRQAYFEYRRAIINSQ